MISSQSHDGHMTSLFSQVISEVDSEEEWKVVQSGSGNSPVEKSADSSPPPPSVVVKHLAVETPAVLAVGERVREGNEEEGE